MTLLEKVQQVKFFVLDVDGILTNGFLYYDSNHVRTRAFHIHDGLGMKLLQKAGIPIAIISGKKSDEVKRRLQDLDIRHVFLGHENKLPVYEELKVNFNLKDSEIAYMGDDLPDLPLLKRAGFAITVPEAPLIIQKNVDYITQKNAGCGAVREVCDYILESQNKMTMMIESYLAGHHER